MWHIVFSLSSHWESSPISSQTAGFFVQHHQTQHVSNTAFIKKYVTTTFSTSLFRTKLYVHVPQQVTHANNSYFIFFELYY